MRVPFITRRQTSRFTSHLRARRATTLVELLLFIGIIAVVGVSILPLLFSTSEERLLQQTVAVVEQNGTQILQTIGYHIRHSEKILDPSGTGTGAVLALQAGSGGVNPTLFGVNSGSLVMVRRTEKEIISSSQVAVADFVARNTSVSGTRQSVFVTFRVSRILRLQAPRSYSRTFQGLFTLLPDEELMGDDCGCAVPGCGGGNEYVWQICDAGSCLTAQTPLQCP